MGYWACLQTNLAGESHYLGGSEEVCASGSLTDTDNTMVFQRVE